MGTRADFYVGEGVNAEWVGSVAYDGYEWREKPEMPLLASHTEEQFRSAVTRILADRDDATVPEQGWPWPWEDSRTTDFAYCFVGDHVDVYCFGHPAAVGPNAAEEDEEDAPKREDWPDMTARKNVAAPGTDRSGLMMFTSRIRQP